MAQEMPGPERDWERVSSGSPGWAQERGRALLSGRAVKHHLLQVLVSS